MAQANVKLTVDASQATRVLNGVQNKTNKLQSAFGGLRTAIKGVGITLLARQAVNTSATFEKLNVRLGLLTKSGSDFAKSQKIAADAQKAFGLSAVEALEGVTDITARLAPLGTSVEDIRTVFFGFNTAAKLAGASAIESSNAFRQLAQALGSGRLAGDEFRSISEQVPTVLAPIAEELGVNIGQLKALAAEGKLTSDVVLRALGRVGKDGSGFLQELIKNDPTQVFKDFSNATQDLSRAFGDQLRPAVESVTKLLTELIIKTTEFVNSPIGQTALILTAIAGAAKGVAVILPAVALGLQKIAFAGGVATIALNAIPFVAIAGLIGGVVTQLIKQRQEQDKVTEAIKKGEVAQLRALESDLSVKMAKEFATINTSNDKRTIAAAERRLALLREQFKPIRDRLNEIIKENAELEKANKLEEERKKKIEESQKAAQELKKKFTEIGEEIERSIKDNLKEAIKGAQSFGEALGNVLDKIADKIIDAQLDKLIGNFGENFGKGASKQGGEGIGAVVGGILGGLFAEGGNPPVGKPSIVGEQGPELFVPRSAGTIIPNNQLGGGVVVNVSVDASGSSISGSDQKGNQFGQELAVLIQQEIIRQKRGGGLLA